MKRKLIEWVALSILLISTNPVLGDENLVKYFSTGFLYSSANADSKTYSIPFMLSWSYQRFNGSLATTYTKINNSKVGLGDTTLSLGYELGGNPVFTLHLKEKFATGDQDKGLSTGENDTSFQLDYFTPLNDKLSFIGSAGYTFVGKPSNKQPLGNKKQAEVGKNSTMQDSATASIGMAYELSSRTGIGLSVDYQQSIYIKLDDQIGLSLFLNQSLNANWNISALVAYDNLQTRSLGITLTTQF